MNEGGNPCFSLIQADNGKLFGIAKNGGAYGGGVIFEWDPDANTYTKKLDFRDNHLFYYLCSPLVQTHNGKFYGRLSVDVDVLAGIIYLWDTTTNITISRIFSQDLYLYPKYGSPMLLAENGKIYGTSNAGGKYGKGTLFEYDPVTNIFETKNNFNSTNGSVPLGGLIELKYTTGVLHAESFCSYTSPSGKYTWTNTGIYRDTILSVSGGDSIINVHLTIRNSATTSTIYPIACDNFASPSGKLWSVSGVYKDTIPNAAGCDSVITVNLIIKSSTTSYMNVTSCNSYASPTGKVWTVSGEYKDTIFNAQGCDSIITVNLTIMSAVTTVTQNHEVLIANADGASYQWIDCDENNTPIEGETHQSFTASTDGHYAVIISQNGCTDTSACFSIVITGSIINTFKNNISIFPNPNNGSFSIDLGKTYSDTEITLTELDGRIIQKEKHHNSQIIEMNLSAFSGMYIIIITSGNEKAVFEILKK
jgi:hypothetical protein